jgi:hypothetical protein
MSGGKGSSTQTIRYAPYLESAHGAYLNHSGSDSPVFSFTDVFNDAVETSPYEGFIPFDIRESFFGHTRDNLGLTLENFPPLWDMFGKFMAGLDVHDLWGQGYEDVVRGPEIEAAVTAHSASMQNDIDTNIMPKFLAGMRDINAVQSTAFIIGKAMIQDSHVREVNKVSAEIRLRALDNSVQIWSKHLEWSANVAKTYQEFFKFYYSLKTDITTYNYEIDAKDKTWKVNLFDSARAMIGALNGAQAGGKTEKGGGVISTILGIAGMAAMFI